MKYFPFFLLVLSLISCNEKAIPVSPKPAATPTTEIIIPSTQVEEKMTTKRDEPIGTIDGCEITYDCINCMQAYTDSIIAYSKKGDSKTKLFELKIEDYYISDAEILTMRSDTFIYIGSTHTHGHSQGYLYLLDALHQKAIRVKQEAGTFKIPDSLFIRNYGGLAKDENNRFSDWASLRNKAGGNEERIFTEAYTLVKLKNGSYILKPGKAGIE